MSILLAALGSAVVSGIGSAIGASRAKKEARAARYARDRAQARINSIIASRQDIVNPYGGVTDLSGMAKDLSSNLTNPYAQLGVATQAAEIQMEQSDIALANTLDTLRATGSGAGGATALAQAALQSKKGISANIEQQEAQNEKLRAQGEANLNQQRMSEAQRLQGIAISEGQRLQSAEAAGKQFEFTAQENRTNADLDAAAGGVAQANQNIAQANQNRASANAGFMSAVGSLGSAAIGSYTGTTGPSTPPKVIGEIEFNDNSGTGLNVYKPGLSGF